MIVRQQQIMERQKAIETEVVLQKELADKILRSQAEWATKKDIENFAKDNGVNLKAIQDDLSKLNARVDGINVAVIHSNGQKDTNVPSTHTTPGNVKPPTINCDGTMVACPDPYGYATNTQHLKLNEDFGDVKVPVGEVGFSTWREHPWDVTIYPRKYSLTTVIGKDDEGRNYTYNKFQIESEGKKTDVKIDDAKFLQEYPSPKFSWWNPRLFLGVSGGANIQAPNADATASVSVAFMSYGQYKIQPDWTFLGLGAGYAFNNEKINFMLTPASYNVGKHIPLMRNIYFGPSLAVDTASGVYLLGTLNVGL